MEWQEIQQPFFLWFYTQPCLIPFLPLPIFYNYYQIWFHVLLFNCNEKWKKEWASSNTPRSNIAWECCIQRISIPSISDGQSERKPVSSELHKIIWAKVQKRYKLLLKKDQICVFCKNAYLQILSFINIKFHEILLSGFSGVVQINCFE